MTDNRFMKEAIEQALKGFSEGGIPIGSLLVHESKNIVLGKGYNRRVQHNDPTAHGEIDCLRNAGRQRSYKDLTIYSTLMPCYMCAGAIVQFGIKKVIAGEDKTFPSARRFMEEHGIDVIDLNLDECFNLLQDFKRQHPDVWNEDIGVE